MKGHEQRLADYPALQIFDVRFAWLRGSFDTGNITIPSKTNLWRYRPLQPLIGLAIMQPIDVRVSTCTVRLDLFAFDVQTGTLAMNRSVRGIGLNKLNQRSIWAELDSV